VADTLYAVGAGIPASCTSVICPQITPAKSALSLATADVDGSVVLRPCAGLPAEENRQQISSTDPNKPLARNR